MIELSVVLPVRNAEAVIGPQLAAVAAQLDRSRCELIVVDDASTDATPDVLAATARDDPRIEVLSVPERRGVNHARNAGLTAARGSKVLFCDSDDVVAEGWLSAMSQALDDWDLVFGALDERRLNPPEFRIGHHFEVETQTTTRAMGFLPRGMGCNLGVRLDVARAVGGFDDSLRYGGTDTDFCWRVQLAGHVPYYAADAVVHYRHPRTLRELARKRFLQGMQHGYLYRKFRSAGMRRRSVRSVIRHVLGVVVRAPLAWRTTRSRRRWVESLSRFAGLIVGSIRHRTLYL